MQQKHSNKNAQMSTWIWFFYSATSFEVSFQTDMRLQQECLKALKSFHKSYVKNSKHGRAMCYYTLVCTKKQYTATPLCLAILWIKLCYRFTSNTSPFEKVVSVSCRQLKSSRSRIRTTITVSTVLFILYNILECFHWGAHGKKIGVHRLWAVLLFCCWKTCTAESRLELGSG